MSSSKKKEFSFIQELKKDRQQTNQYKKDIVHRLLEKCRKDIKIFNSMNKTNYTFECPMFLTGFPTYDVKEITLELNKELKKIGLSTTYKIPDTIFISWE